MKPLGEVALVTSFKLHDEGPFSMTMLRLRRLSSPSRPRTVAVLAASATIAFASSARAVFDTTNRVELGPHRTAKDGIVDTDVMLKSVLRRGALQGGFGPSVALEVGVLAPTEPSDVPGASGDHLAIDLGVRGQILGDDRLIGLRFGLTWGASVFAPRA